MQTRWAAHPPPPPPRPHTQVNQRVRGPTGDTSSIADMGKEAQDAVLRDHEHAKRGPHPGIVRFGLATSRTRQGLVLACNEQTTLHRLAWAAGHRLRTRSTCIDLTGNVVSSVIIWLAACCMRAQIVRSGDDVCAGVMQSPCE